jgi:hypothetical protein
MSMQVPGQLGAHGTGGVRDASTPAGNAAANPDNYRYTSMNLLPNFVNMKGSLGLQCLKAVFFAATSPLLLPFMAGHALAVVYHNARNPGRVENLNKLLEDKKNAMHELALHKSVYKEAKQVLREYPPERVTKLRMDYPGESMPPDLRKSLEVADVAETTRASWKDTQQRLEAKIKDLDSKIVPLKEDLGIKDQK